MRRGEAEEGEGGDCAPQTTILIRASERTILVSA